MAQDPRWKNTDPGIRDKHPGFETLYLTSFSQIEKCDRIDVGTVPVPSKNFCMYDKYGTGYGTYAYEDSPTFSVVDSDPDGLGSKSFCLIGINSTQIKKL